MIFVQVVENLDKETKNFFLPTFVRCFEIINGNGNFFVRFFFHFQSMFYWIMKQTEKWIDPSSEDEEEEKYLFEKR